MNTQDKLTILLCAVSLLSTLIHVYENIKLKNINAKLKSELNTFMEETPPPPDICFVLPPEEIPTTTTEEAPPTKAPPLPTTPNPKTVKIKENKPLCTQAQYNRMCRDKGYKCLNTFTKHILDSKDIGKLPDGKKITKLMVQRANYAVMNGWVNCV